MRGSKGAGSQSQRLRVAAAPRRHLHPGSGFVGTVLGGGKLLIGILFLAIGAVLPWMFLGFKRSRRRKAFGRTCPTRCS